MLGTVEHIVGGDLDHPSPSFANRSSQVGRGLRIQQGTEPFIVLGLVDSRIGSAVDNAVDLVLIDEGLDGLLVGDIQLCHICIKIGMLGIDLLQQLHLVSQLAITARNQNIHHYSLIKLQSFFFVFLIIIAQHANEGCDFLDGMGSVGGDILML